MKAGRGLPALVAMLAAGALSAPPAHAGSYDVYSCTIDGAYFPTTPGSTSAAWISPTSTRGAATTTADRRFTFRLRLRPNHSYPYARGTSKAVRIRVG